MNTSEFSTYSSNVKQSVWGDKIVCADSSYVIKL